MKSGQSDGRERMNATTIIRVAVMVLVAHLGAMLAPNAAFAERVRTKRIVQEMPFEQCLRSIRQTAQEVGQAPINIIEVDVLRIVKWEVTTGSVMVSCNKMTGERILEEFEDR